MLVMFLRARRWPVGACAFHIQPATRFLRISTKLPTFVLPVAEIVLPILPHDGLACTVYRAYLGQPIIAYRGVIVVALVKIANEFDTAGADIRLSDKVTSD